MTTVEQLRTGKGRAHPADDLGAVSVELLAANLRAGAPHERRRLAEQEKPQRLSHDPSSLALSDF